jgi:serine/threonine protein phosphatase 1
MSKYALSDLHGCYDKFIAMLDLVHFTENDELYIIGDILDRGDKPLEIYDYILAHKNIQMIKGNHEDIFEDYFRTKHTEMWYLNGGITTHRELIIRGQAYEDSLYEFTSNLPLYKIVDNNILVHAGLYLPENYKHITLEEILGVQNSEYVLWDRSHINHEKKLKGYNIISGHTPVQFINGSTENVSIIIRNGNHYIDCGCVYYQLNGKLACLRLDDMAEFYC